MPSVSLSSLFYLIPLYFLVIAPLLRQFSPQDSNSSIYNNGAYDDDIDENEDTSLSLNSDVLSLDDGTPFTCDPETSSDAYRLHILSQSPLVIYIEDFLSKKEADHLVNIRYGIYLTF